MRVLLPVLLAVAGCSSGAETVATSASPQQPVTTLQVEVLPTPGAPVRTWTLTCEPTGGDHPQAARACADLARSPSPLAPLDEDLACTEQYGGPQTAVLRGTWRGDPVSLELARTDGCRIAQWDGLGAVLEPGA